VRAPSTSATGQLFTLTRDTYVHYPAGTDVRSLTRPGPAIRTIIHTIHSMVVVQYHIPLYTLCCATRSSLSWRYADSEAHERSIRSTNRSIDQVSEDTRHSEGSIINLAARFGSVIASIHQKYFSSVASCTSMPGIYVHLYAEKTKKLLPPQNIHWCKDPFALLGRKYLSQFGT
jgi:hypothetical protein